MAATLTSALINKRLQIAQCCAAAKGVEYIAKLKKGEKCEQLLSDAELVIDLVDSIKGFVPEGEVVSGDQACIDITVNAVNLNSVFGITVGTATYLILAAGTVDTTVAATNMAALINTFYPQSYPYTATSSGNVITICGSTYDAANGTTVVASITNGNVSPNNGTLTGGTPAVLQGENCITNEQVQHILDKLCNVCEKPCTEYVNF